MSDESESEENYGTRQLTGIVIDCGAATVKAGLADEDAPRCVFPSLVGTPKQVGAWVGPTKRAYYCGQEAVRYRESLLVRSPMEGGIIQHVEDWRQLMAHTFESELRLDPAAYPVLLIAHPLTPGSNREEMTRIMFEVFKVPSLYIASGPTLVLQASGPTTGVVLEVGESVALSVPIYEGFAMPHAILESPVAGGRLTAYLGGLLQQQGTDLTSAADRPLLRDIKEQDCSVSLNFEQELEDSKRAKSSARSHTLPNGRVITLKSERFQCPEALFQPALVGVEAPGIHELVNRTIKKTDEDIQKEFYANIVLAGGSTLFPGLASRLLKEITAVSAYPSKVRVVKRPERQFSAWQGGAILTTRESFQRQWITQQEYAEEGPGVVRSKFF